MSKTSMNYIINFNLLKGNQFVFDVSQQKILCSPQLIVFTKRYVDIVRE